MSDLWFLPPFDFLGRLSPDDRAALDAIGHEHRFGKKEYVFRSGAEDDNVYFLIEGRVRIAQISAAGKEVILWFCFPGEIFGIADLTGNEPRQVSAQAYVPTTVKAIPQHEFREFLLHHPQISLHVIGLLCCRLRVLGDNLLNLSRDNVKQRVLKLLTRLSARYGRVENGSFYLDVRLTHQEMADMIGASRQTFTTTLNELAKEGLIHVRNKIIHIDDPALRKNLIGVHGGPGPDFVRHF